VTDLLFYGATERSAAMRHELPIAILSPFLLGIVAGRMRVMASPLEVERIVAAAPDAVLHDMRALGLHELLDSGMNDHQPDLELASRPAAAMGVRTARSSIRRCPSRSPTGSEPTASCFILMPKTSRRAGA
jgi:Xaa-Pro aminopeptidase